MVFYTSHLYSQTLPQASQCSSGDLELAAATLPPNAGEDACSCSGTRTLMLSIKNKTGSERTSFAFWGTLERYDADGVLTSSTPITGCNGPIAKNSNKQPFTITTLPYNQIQISCNESLKITNLFLAWTDASPGSTCPLNPATINPKCGVLPGIQILAGVDAAFDVVSATCFNGVSSITTSPFGGKAPYTYSWVASNGGTIPQGQASAQNLSNLTPGTYTLTITDANGCKAVKSRKIENPSALTLGTCSKTDVTCFGATDGSVTAGAVANAVGTVSYSWKNSAGQVVSTTANQTGLPAGLYSLTVADNCGSKSCNVTIGGPALGLSLDACAKTDVTCYNASNGTATAGTVHNAVGNITYAWRNAANVLVSSEEKADKLPPGIYTCTVTDNCSSKTCSVTIGGPLAGLAIANCTKTDVTCFGKGDGTATAGAVTNAIGTVSYAWKNANNQTVGSSATASNLSPGTYTLTVMDLCTTVNCTVTISGPAAALSIGACLKTDVSCFGGANGTATAGEVTNAVGAVSYSWKNAANAVISTLPTATGLSAGVYTLEVKDNCFTKTCTVTVGGPSAALSLDPCSKTDATCTQGGSASAGQVKNAVGPILYNWKNAANVVVGNTASVADLPAGTYTLTVSDNCSSKTCTVTINAPANLPAPLVCIVQPSLCGSAGSVTITNTLPGAGISFSIDNGNTWQASNVFTGLNAGSVTGIKVKIGDCISPAANCSNSSCAPPAPLTSSAREQANPDISGTDSEASTAARIAADDVVEVRLAAGHAVAASPNPFNSKIRFAVESGISGYGTLDLYNLAGQRIASVYQGYFVAGRLQIVDYVVPAATRGNLVYVFSVGNQKTSGKLISVRK